MKKSILIFIGLVVFVALVGISSYVIVASPRIQKSNVAVKPSASESSSPNVTINGNIIKVTVAKTPSELEQGLSGVSSLAPDEGMLFDFQSPGTYSFWMKEMLFDLDFIWIKDSKIVDLSENVSSAQDKQYELISPKEPVNYVLEVPAGTVQRLGIKVGDSLSIDTK